jgi:cyclopropane fatty-acyl-phospholipid synthase-like methyltransferase
LERLAVASDHRVVDLGCGWGELLLRAVADMGASAIGVDTDEQVLQRGRDSAQQRGLSDRVSFVNGNAAEWTGQCERAICIGAVHAWGGTIEALRGLHDIVPARSCARSSTPGGGCCT